MLCLNSVDKSGCSGDAIFEYPNTKEQCYFNDNNYKKGLKMHVIKRTAFLAVMSTMLASCDESKVVNNNIEASGEDNSNASMPEVTNKITLTARNVPHAGELFREEISTPVSVFEAIRTEYVDVIPELTLSNDSRTVDCPQGGTSSFVVSSNGGTFVQSYDNCEVSSGNIINGSITSVISNIRKAENFYTMSLTFDNYTETSNSEIVTFNGTSVINARFGNNDRAYLDVESSRTVNSSVVGEAFTASPFTYSLNYSLSNVDAMEIDAVSGVIAMSQAGAIEYSWLEGQKRVLITGQGNEKGYLDVDEEGYELEFVDSANESHGIRRSNDQTTDVFGDNVAPIFTEHNGFEVKKGEAKVFEFETWLSDKNLDVLDVSISAISTPENAVYKFQPQQGFSSVLVAETGGEYVVKLRAVDPEGLSAEGNVRFTVVVDSNEGEETDTTTGDDGDKDGDGVLDKDDAFPLDNSESIDTDKDGIGNNADADDDGDGIIDTIDLFPLDARCGGESSSVEGRCISVVAAESEELAVNDASGIIYFLAKGVNEVVRWDITDKAFLSSYELGSVTSSTSTAVKMAFSAAHNRLYLGYDNGALTYVDLSSGSEIALSSLPLAVGGLASVGNFLLAQDASGAWATHYVIAKDGTISDAKEWNYVSRVYKWDAKTNRVYYFRDGTSPNDLHYEVIDQSTGQITSDGETPYHGDYGVAPPIIISTTDSAVLMGSGNMFEALELTWDGAIPGDIEDGVWPEDGLIVIRTIDGKTVLERRDVDLGVVEDVKFSGVAKALFKRPDSDRYVVLTVAGGALQVFDYEPNDDGDGDSVPNTEDHFPTDAAASVDSDHDGFPSAWNDGYSEADSTTGLVLDEYPNDAACHMLKQGNGTHCDYSQLVPAFTPDQVVSDDNGIFYMLSVGRNLIYRWSAVVGDYIAPIVVGTKASLKPTSTFLMEYSAAHNRLYFGYEDGQVTFLDIGNYEAGEQPFVTVAKSVGGIASVGNYLLVQDASGAWATHYIFSKDGQLTDSKDWNTYSKAYAWDKELSRVYFFRDNTSPNDLHYEEIDQSTGKITDSGETPYHGDYDIAPPILVTPNDHVITGAGDVYNTTSLDWEKSLSGAFEHGVVLSNGEVVTIATVEAHTHMNKYNEGMGWVSDKNYLGWPVGVFESDGKAYIVTRTYKGLIFTQN